jgi:hypothetical protein
MTAVRSATDARRNVVSVIKIALTVIFEKFPQQLYMAMLLHLPALYFTRVSRILEDAELTMHKVRQLYKPAQHTAVAEPTSDEERAKEKEEELLSVAHFRMMWGLFVDSIVREWKTLNIISALLLSCVKLFHRH